MFFSFLQNAMRTKFFFFFFLSNTMQNQRKNWINIFSRNQIIEILEFTATFLRREIPIVLFLFNTKNLSWEFVNCNLILYLIGSYSASFNLVLSVTHIYLTLSSTHHNKLSISQPLRGSRTLSLNVT